MDLGTSARLAGCLVSSFSLGELASKAAARPEILNLLLATALVRQITMLHQKDNNEVLSEKFMRTGYANNVLVADRCMRQPTPWDGLFASRRKPALKTELRIMVEDIKEHEEVHATGGMRRPRTSFTKLSGVVAMGKRARALLDNALRDHPSLGPACLASVGKAANAEQIPQGALNDIRARLAKLWGFKDVEPIRDGLSVLKSRLAYWKVGVQLLRTQTGRSLNGCASMASDSWSRQWLA